jgi:hypothetical protein
MLFLRLKLLDKGIREFDLLLLVHKSSPLFKDFYTELLPPLIRLKLWYL